MKTPLKSVPYYVPGNVPVEASELRRFIDDELRKISYSINRPVVWDDVRTSGLATSKAGNNDPSIGTLTNGLKVNQFSASALNEVFFSIQLPHRYKEGSTIEPHIHWTPTTTGAGNVQWGLEYSFANAGATLPASTTITATTAASGVSLQHQISAFPSIVGSTLHISSVIICRLFRDGANAADTYAGLVNLLDIDFHVQCDAEGSIKEYYK